MAEFTATPTLPPQSTDMTSWTTLSPATMPSDLAETIIARATLLLRSGVLHTKRDLDQFERDIKAGKKGTITSLSSALLWEQRKDPLHFMRFALDIAAADTLAQRIRAESTSTPTFDKFLQTYDDGLKKIPIELGKYLSTIDKMPTNAASGLQDKSSAQEAQPSMDDLLNHAFPRAQGDNGDMTLEGLEVSLFTGIMSRLKDLDEQHRAHNSSQAEESQTQYSIRNPHQTYLGTLLAAQSGDYNAEDGLAWELNRQVFMQSSVVRKLAYSGELCSRMLDIFEEAGYTVGVWPDLPGNGLGDEPNDMTRAAADMTTSLRSGELYSKVSIDGPVGEQVLRTWVE